MRPEILGMLVEPHAEEWTVTGGTEWSTLAKREVFVQVHKRGDIARGSMVVLSTLRQGWQQQPSANTKRSKLHRAALKAGLWNEPPQLARVLATGF